VRLSVLRQPAGKNRANREHAPELSQQNRSVDPQVTPGDGIADGRAIR
jgi:hypothetical protein